MIASHVMLTTVNKGTSCADPNPPGKALSASIGLGGLGLVDQAGPIYTRPGLIRLEEQSRMG